MGVIAQQANCDNITLSLKIKHLARSLTAFYLEY